MAEKNGACSGKTTQSRIKSAFLLEPEKLVGREIAEANIKPGFADGAGRVLNLSRCSLASRSFFSRRR